MPFKKGHKTWNKGIKKATNTGRTHFKKGFTPWNKGKKGQKGYWKGKKFSKKHKQKLRKARLGVIPWNKNTKGIMKINSGSFKEGQTPWNYIGYQKEKYGYILIHSPKHPFHDKHNCVRRSRLVMEKYLKHYLKSKEIVHHINGIKDDDRIENLMLFKNHSEHMKYHHPKGYKFKITTLG